MAHRLTISEARQRAGRFCSLRERSPEEVREKLKAWKLSNSEAESVLKELIHQGFVDEQRFANAYCHDKFEFNSWGKQKIKVNIYKHRLPEEVIRQALDRLDETKYQARLMELGSLKWSKLDNDEPLKRKQKTVNYLANKGFELDLIWKIVSELEGKGH